MSYEATGTIQSIGEIQEFGTKGFKKREVVLVIPDGKYPQTVALEFQGERVDMPDKYSEGDEVSITFDLRGREHNGRVYNTLNAWKIKGKVGATPPKPAAPMSKEGLAETSLNPDPNNGVPF